MTVPPTALVACRSSHILADRLAAAMLPFFAGAGFLLFFFAAGYPIAMMLILLTRSSEHPVVA